MKKILNFKKIKQATIILSQITEIQKNKFIDFLTNEIQTRKSEIIMANKRDLRKSEKLNFQ